MVVFVVGIVKCDQPSKTAAIFDFYLKSFFSPSNKFKTFQFQYLAGFATQVFLRASSNNCFHLESSMIIRWSFEISYFRVVTTGDKLAATDRAEMSLFYVRHPLETCSPVFSYLHSNVLAFLSSHTSLTSHCMLEVYFENYRYNLLQIYYLKNTDTDLYLTNHSIRYPKFYEPEDSSVSDVITFYNIYCQIGTVFFLLSMT